MNTVLNNVVHPADDPHDDPVIDKLFVAIVDAILGQGVSNLQAHKAANAAVNYLIKEGA